MKSIDINKEVLRAEKEGKSVSETLRRLGIPEEKLHNRISSYCDWKRRQEEDYPDWQWIKTELMEQIENYLREVHHASPSEIMEACGIGWYSFELARDILKKRGRIESFLHICPLHLDLRERFYRLKEGSQ